MQGMLASPSLPSRSLLIPHINPILSDPSQSFVRSRKFERCLEGLGEFLKFCSKPCVSVQLLPVFCSKYALHLKHTLHNSSTHLGPSATSQLVYEIMGLLHVLHMHEVRRCCAATCSTGIVGYIDTPGTRRQYRYRHN